VIDIILNSMQFLKTYKLTSFKDPKLEEKITVHFENFEFDY
jgi:hypothetical protein